MSVGVGDYLYGTCLCGFVAYFMPLPSAHQHGTNGLAGEKVSCLCQPISTVLMRRFVHRLHVCLYGL